MRDGRGQDSYDFIVVGSGFGGSVSALRLAEKGYRVAVLEMGRRWDAETLPRSSWAISRWLWWPAVGLRGFFGIRLFRHVMVLHGNAVGGGSITYASTLLEPREDVWDAGTWAGLEDWRAVLPEHFATAKRMLGVTQNRILGQADHKLRAMAEAYGVENTFYPTQVGVLFAQDRDAPGTVYPDPFFEGQGPSRTACIGCGGCMVGCRHDAKNTLDKNYLFLAEQNGAEVYAETKVVDVKPLGGSAEGSEGYQVHTVRSTAILGTKKRVFTCRGVVFAASSLGTQELLLRLKQKGSLPGISDALGRHVRTNAESLIGVRYPGSPEDLSEGIAIGSGICLDGHTHIQATRYPRGWDGLGVLLTVMTRGRQGWIRVLIWLWTLLRLFLTQPVTTLRALLPYGFARETIILLCMQNLDSQLRMRLKRPWYWPFRKALSTEGDRIPTFIPEANEFAAKAAKATGGVAATSITEILFNVPTTAHCMGGAVMSASPEQGVCDARNRVFGYRNMFICDGSVLSANLGVNPSLTISALTERAMSHIPPVEQQKWDA
jgi:cholesterol oxidase